MTERHPYQHRWYPSNENGIPVDRCVCGIMRRLDGKSDDGVCPSAVHCLTAESRQ